MGWRSRGLSVLQVVNFVTSWVGALEDRRSRRSSVLRARGLALSRTVGLLRSLEDYSLTNIW